MLGASKLPTAQAQDGSKSLHGQQALTLLLQIVQTKLGIYSDEEKQYLLNAVNVASSSGLFRGFEDVTSNCFTQLALVSPAANLLQARLPLNIIGFNLIRRRFLELLAQLHQRLSEVIRTQPSQDGKQQDVHSAAPHAGDGKQQDVNTAAPQPSPAVPITALPPREDLRKLSASQLKSMIKSVGLSVAGCFEKEDLIERLCAEPTDAVAKLAADVRGSSWAPPKADGAVESETSSGEPPSIPTEPGQNDQSAEGKSSVTTPSHPQAADTNAAASIAENHAGRQDAPSVPVGSVTESGASDGTQFSVPPHHNTQSTAPTPEGQDDQSARKDTCGTPDIPESGLGKRGIDDSTDQPPLDEGARAALAVLRKRASKKARLIATPLK